MAYNTSNDSLLVVADQYEAEGILRSISKVLGTILLS